jgi:apolipoprotein N-acyltransferase
MGNGRQRARDSSGLETTHRGITATRDGIALGAGLLFAAISGLAGLWWCVIHMSFITMIVVWTTLIGGSILIGAGISRSDPLPGPSRPV